MLMELLAAAAESDPERAAIINQHRRITYSELHARARSLESGLSQVGSDRFACLISDVAELLALLSAASAAGIEPCIYPPDLEPRAVAELADAFAHDVLVSDVAVASIEDRRVFHINELLATDVSRDGRGEDGPILILTTGTTGVPKGTRHHWSRLAAVARERSRPAVWLLAYNPHQFAGLQMLLHTVATRGTLVVPPSRQPSDVMAAMRQHGVTHVSATPTFWRMLTGQLDRQTADALPLQQITLGGEAVPAALLTRLETLFPEARIAQVYASSEFGSSVSVGDRRAGLPLSVLDRSDDATVQFKIVEGELHARSRVGMLGYHGAPDRTDEWHPTGDLVEVRDGRIHFVGRTSDTINVGGVKVHPLPVEDVVGAVDGVALVRAYGHPNPVAGEIVAVDVVPTGDETDDLERRIRVACTKLPRAAQPRRIRFVDRLETRGGKVVRRRSCD